MSTAFLSNIQIEQRSDFTRLALKVDHLVKVLYCEDITENDFLPGEKKPHDNTQRRKTIVEQNDDKLT